MALKQHYVKATFSGRSTSKLLRRGRKPQSQLGSRKRKVVKKR